MLGITWGTVLKFQSQAAAQANETRIPGCTQTPVFVFVFQTSPGDARVWPELKSLV